MVEYTLVKDYKEKSLAYDFFKVVVFSPMNCYTSSSIGVHNNLYFDIFTLIY